MIKLPHCKAILFALEGKLAASEALFGGEIAGSCELTIVKFALISVFMLFTAHLLFMLYWMERNLRGNQRGTLVVCLNFLTCVTLSYDVASVQPTNFFSLHQRIRKRKRKTEFLTFFFNAFHLIQQFLHLQRCWTYKEYEELKISVHDIFKTSIIVYKLST